MEKPVELEPVGQPLAEHPPTPTPGHHPNGHQPHPQQQRRYTPCDVQPLPATASNLERAAAIAGAAFHRDPTGQWCLPPSKSSLPLAGPLHHFGFGYLFECLANSGEGECMSRGAGGSRISGVDG